MEFPTHDDWSLVIPELWPRERLGYDRLLLQDLQLWSSDMPWQMVHSGRYKVRENWFQSVFTTLNRVVSVIWDDSLKADVVKVFSAFKKRHEWFWVLTLKSEIDAVESLINVALTKIPATTI